MLLICVCERATFADRDIYVPRIQSGRRESAKNTIIIQMQLPVNVETGSANVIHGMYDFV